MSGLIAPGRPPRRVLDAVRRGEIDAVASWELADEIAGVLRRERFPRYRVTEQDVREVLALLAPLLPTIEIDVPIRDPGDAPLVSAALMGNAEAVVTGDRDILEDASLRAWLADRGVAVLTPRNLLDRLGL